MVVRPSTELKTLTIRRPSAGAPFWSWPAATATTSTTAEPTRTPVRFNVDDMARPSLCI